MQKAQAENQGGSKPDKSESTNKTTTSQNQTVATPKAVMNQGVPTPQPSSVASTSTNGMSPRKASSPSVSISSQAGNRNPAIKPTRETPLVSSQQSLNSTVSVKKESVQEPEYNARSRVGNPAAPPVPSLPPTFRGSDASRSLSDWESIAGSSVGWTPSQSPEQTFAYSNLNTASFSSAAESVAVPELEALPYRNRSGGDAFLGMAFAPPPEEEWAGRRSAGHRGSNATDSTHSTAAPYTPSLQQSGVSPSRRASSDELGDSLEDVAVEAPKQYNMSHLPKRVDVGGSWKVPVPGKKVDLAARRKRPRPAAIGTSGSNSTRGAPASMSPTARMPSFGPGPAVRHSKSAQSLNSRYAGVRKASATPRSPFNLATFAEGGPINSAKVDLSRRLRPSVSTNTLVAPSTPLTPEDFHSLLPTTPSDGALYMSTQPGNDQFYSTATAAQGHANIASPPSTPLPTTTINSLACQNVAPPMSAPPHYGTFPDYNSCEGNPAGGDWTETTSGDTTSFLSAIHPSQSDNVPPITYGSAMSQSGPSAGSVSFSGPPDLQYSVKGVPVAGSTNVKNVAGFYAQQFPGPQGSHQFLA